MNSRAERRKAKGSLNLPEERGTWTRRDALRLACLMTVAAILWCFCYGRWSADTWSIPLEYGTDLETSDAKGMLATMKAAMDGDFTPFFPKRISLLGAPGVAIWDDVPFIEQFQFWLVGIVARVIGLFAAANFAVMVGQVLAVGAMYVSCRLMGADYRWSMVAGILFGFATMAFARQIHHLPVALYWHVPLGLVVCHWLINSEVVIGSRGFRMAAGVAVVTGLQNPYYTNLFIQLVGLSVLVLVVRKQWRAAGAGLLLGTAAFIAFLLMNVNMFLYHASAGPNPGAVYRNFQWLEYYALKPLDMFLPPPGHVIDALGQFVARYREQALVQGEVPASNYLGIFGIAALCWLVVDSFRKFAGTEAKPIPFETMQILWIAAYSIVGGANGLIGAFGIHLFRSTNRFSIFILAIALLYAARRLSAFSLKPAWLTAGGLLICGIALVDQSVPKPTGEQIAETRNRLEADREFVAELERRLPEGAMLMQIPFAPFPEASAPGVPPYDYFRPYLHAKHIRISYGAIKGREGDLWQMELGNKDLRAAIAEIKQKGFAALYIQHAAFPEDAKPLMRALASLGHEEVIPNRLGDVSVVVLK
jgi:phosphoglycerol transferase